MIFRNNYFPARRWVRKWWNSSVEVSTNSGQVKGVGLNISQGGMGLFAVANLQVGSQVEIEFVPPESSRPVRRRAAVCHRALYLYGIEFLHSDFKSTMRQAPQLPQKYP